MTDASIVTLRVPAAAWRILEETLRLDARSSAFDPELRRQIEAALGQVEDVSLLKIVVPLVTTADLADVVDDLFNNFRKKLLDQDGRPYSREQVEHALAAWLGELSQELLGNLAAHAAYGLQWTEGIDLPPHSDRDLDDEARGERADIEYARARERLAA